MYPAATATTLPQIACCTGGPGGELMRLYDILMGTGVVHCNLLPQLQPFLKQPVVQVDQEVS